MGKTAFWQLGLILLLAACGGSGGSDNREAADDDGGPTQGALQVQGTVTSAQGLAVDGDTNDPEAPLTPNDDSSQAQVVVPPVAVAGFVTQAPTGVAGDRFASEPDEFDVYRTTLVTGQSVHLDIMGQADLDLGLFTSDGEAIDLSINEGNRSEEIVFDGETGEYIVVVRAFSGRSLYTLGIALQSLAPARAASFVPGEVLVSWAPGAPSKAAVSQLGLQRQDGEARWQRYQLTSASKARLPQDRWPAFVRPIARDAEGRAAQATRLMAKQLALTPGVAQVSLNYLRQPSKLPDDPLLNFQWHYRQINLPQAWDVTEGSADVTVAVIDTGVLLQHPELDGLISPDGFDFIASPQISNDGDGRDANANDSGDGLRLGENSYHGTHVAGTIAAETDNGVGVAGVNWNARILPIRALGVGGGTDFDIAQGIRYAAGLENVTGVTLSPDQRADIINMSLGGPGRCAGTAFEDAIADAVAAGVIVIVAAGNESTAEPSVPASCPGAISVSATDINDSLAFYSNFGPDVDIAAPGGDSRLDLNSDGVGDGVLSTHFSDAFNEFNVEIQNGTSMAAPHVAGVAALMKAVNPQLDPVGFDSLLRNGELTVDLGAPGRDDQFGFGRVDAARAVRAADAGVRPFIAADPESVYLGLGDSAVVEFSDPTESGAITGVTLSDDANFDGFDWLQIEPVDVAASGLGQYRLVVDRSGLPADAPASFRANITATAASGETAALGVWASSSGVVQPGELGRLFVLLVDPESGETVAEAVASGDTTGQQRYRFDAVPPGDYLLFAGTDHNNDGGICAPGEACGGFPTLDELELVRVSENSLSLAGFIAAIDLGVVSGASQAGPAPRIVRRPGY